MLAVDAYRQAVRTCRLCPVSSVLRTAPHGPRFGLGPPDRPRLMIVGQNPPSDVTRSLHGGWMLHYTSPEYVALKQRSELLVADLVALLGLAPAEVYVTQAVKCATHGNLQMMASVERNCWQTHLRAEVTAVAPAFVLVFGSVTAGIMHDSGLLPSRVGGPSGPCSPTVARHHYRDVDPTDGCKPQAGVRVGRFANVPHPQVVGRFLDRESWLTVVSGFVAAGWQEPAGTPVPDADPTHPYTAAAPQDTE